MLKTLPFRAHSQNCFTGPQTCSEGCELGFQLHQQNTSSMVALHLQISRATLPRASLVAPNYTPNKIVSALPDFIQGGKS